MSTPSTSDVQPALTPREVTEIIRSFSQSDLKELRLSVGGVELLLSRNDVVDVGRSAPRPAVATDSSSSADLATRENGAPDGGLSQADAAQGGAAQAGVSQAHPSQADTAQADTAQRLPPGHVPVRAQAVGVFYRRPSPDEAPYVEVGTTIGVGDPIGVMEVMKMFTTVRAEVAGTVESIEVADGTLVEYDQVLMVVDTHP